MLRKEVKESKWRSVGRSMDKEKSATFCLCCAPPTLFPSLSLYGLVCLCVCMFSTLCARFGDVAATMYLILSCAAKTWERFNSCAFYSMQLWFAIKCPGFLFSVWPFYLASFFFSSSRLVISFFSLFERFRKTSCRFKNNNKKNYQLNWLTNYSSPFRSFRSIRCVATSFFSIYMYVYV